MSDALDRLRAANPVPRDLSTGWSRTVEGVEARGRAEWGVLTEHPRRPSRFVAVAVAAVLVLVVAGSVFVLQSGTDSGQLSTASVVDELADAEWRPLDPVPDSGFSPVTTFWTGREILTFGHLRNTSEWSSYSYAPGRGWRRLAPPPVSVAPERTVFTGKVALIWNLGWAYDVKHDRWRRTAAFPVDTGAQPTATWTGSALIVTAGRSVFSYDPTGDVWEGQVEAPVLMDEATAVWDGREIVFVLDFDVADQAWAFNPASQSWRAIEAPPVSGFALNGLVSDTEGIIDVAWFEAPPATAYLRAVRLPRGASRWRSVAPVKRYDFLCRAAPVLVRGGLAVACLGSNRSFGLDFVGAEWRRLPHAPGPLATTMWTGRSLVAVTQHGRFVRLS